MTQQVRHFSENGVQDWVWSREMVMLRHLRDRFDETAREATESGERGEHGQIRSSWAGQDFRIRASCVIYRDRDVIESVINEWYSYRRKQRVGNKRNMDSLQSHPWVGQDFKMGPSCVKLRGKQTFRAEGYNGDAVRQIMKWNRKVRRKGRKEGASELLLRLKEKTNWQWDERPIIVY
jgi:hypothetical protein